MIIKNGTIQFKVKTAGGIDPATGFPNQNTDVSWGIEIACQYVYNSYNLQRKSQQGESVVAVSYTILIEGSKPEGEILRLKDNNGNLIGDYNIASHEYLRAVNETKIIV